jgi:predicted DNA-binding transcriptional regulator AlpA
MASTMAPPAPSVGEHDVLTKRDLARLLRVCERQIEHLSNRGEIPAGIKLGRLVRWDRATIMRWLADRQRAAGVPVASNAAAAGGAG